MKGNVIVRNAAAVICMAVFSGAVYAGDTSLNFALPSSGFYTKDTRAYVLALNEGDAAAGQATDAAAATAATPAAAVSTAKPASFEPPLITGGKVHQYLGLATLATTVLTAVTAPEGCETNCTATTTRQTSGTHQTLGRATAVLAAATVTSGLLFHWDDVKLEDGFTDPDNLHALIGTVGAAAMLSAVNTALNAKASGNGHNGRAIIGGVLMAAAVKITW